MKEKYYIINNAPKFYTLKQIINIYFESLEAHDAERLFSLRVDSVYRLTTIKEGEQITIKRCI